MILCHCNVVGIAPWLWQQQSAWSKTRARPQAKAHHGALWRIMAPYSSLLAAAHHFVNPIHLYHLALITQRLQFPRQRSLLRRSMLGRPAKDNPRKSQPPSDSQGNMVKKYTRPIKVNKFPYDLRLARLIMGFFHPQSRPVASTARTTSTNPLPSATLHDLPDDLLEKVALQMKLDGKFGSLAALDQASKRLSAVGKPILWRDVTLRNASHATILFEKSGAHLRSLVQCVGLRLLTVSTCNNVF